MPKPVQEKNVALVAELVGFRTQHVQAVLVKLVDMRGNFVPLPD